MGRVENRDGGRRIGEELFAGGFHTEPVPRSDPYASFNRSRCFRPERSSLPGGIHTRWSSVPLHGTRSERE